MCSDFQDYGHIRHPYRDYVEGKADIPERDGDRKKKGGPEDAATS